MEIIMKHSIKHTLRIFTLLILCQATVTVPMWNTAKQYGRRIFAGATTAAHYGISLGIPMAAPLSVIGYSVITHDDTFEKPINHTLSYGLEHKYIEPISFKEEQLYRPIVLPNTKLYKIKSAALAEHKTTDEKIQGNTISEIMLNALPQGMWNKWKEIFEKPNAAALPNNTILFSDSITTEEMKSILEHEIEHIKRTHTQKQFLAAAIIPLATQTISQVTKKAFTTIFNITPNPYSITKNVLKIPSAFAKLTLTYTALSALERHHEWQADAGIANDPHQLEIDAQFLEKKHPEKNELWYKKISKNIFSSHPDPDLRAAELRRRAHKIKMGATKVKENEILIS
jgi:Zn-dependent protease with chaperone function